MSRTMIDPSGSQRAQACDWSLPCPSFVSSAWAQVIASTGVKGAVAGPDSPASGYDGEFNLSNSQDGALYSAFMARKNSSTFAEHVLQPPAAAQPRRAVPAPPALIPRVEWSPSSPA